MLSFTEEQIRSIVESDAYQRWKARADSSVDWRYWCFKTLYPNKGVKIHEAFRLFVYVYLEHDTEDIGVEPMERAIEFTIWLIDTQYSDKARAVNRLLKGYAVNHADLIERIAKNRFKDSDVLPYIINYLNARKIRNRYLHSTHELPPHRHRNILAG